jgi:hypothetical protein
LRLDIDQYYRVNGRQAGRLYERLYTSEHACDTMTENALEWSVFQVMTDSYARTCRQNSDGNQCIYLTSLALRGYRDEAVEDAENWQIKPELYSNCLIQLTGKLSNSVIMATV